MKIFLDTNVMVDFCAEREPFYSNAATIIEMGHNGNVSLIVSSLTTPEVLPDSAYRS